MSRRKSLASRELRRLMTALALYWQQQWERVGIGGVDEADDVWQETNELAGQILPMIKDALDEDMLEQLERFEDYEEDFRMAALPWAPPSMRAMMEAMGAMAMPGGPWSFFNPAAGPWGFGTGRRRSRQASRTSRRVENRVADFRDDLIDQIRAAERADQEIEGVIDESLAALRKDLMRAASKKGARQQKG